MRRAWALIAVLLISLMGWTPGTLADNDIQTLNRLGSDVGDYVPEHGGALVASFSGENETNVVSLVDGSVLAGPVPGRFWTYEHGRLLTCGPYSEIAVRDAVTLNEIVSYDTTDLYLPIRDCSVAGGKVFFVRNSLTGGGVLMSLDLTSGQVLDNLADLSGVRGLASHPAHPDRLFVERPEGVASSRKKVTVYDVSGPTPQTVAAVPLAEDSLNTQSLHFNDAGDEFVVLRSEHGGRYDASTLASLGEFRNDDYQHLFTILPSGDYALGYGLSPVAGYEVRLFDLHSGRTIGAHPAPENIRGLVADGAGSPVLMHSPTEWFSLPTTPTITNLQPSNVEVGYTEPVTVEYWAQADAVEVLVGGIPVAFDLVPRGIEFESPQLPLGNHQVEILFADGTQLTPHPDHVLPVVEGPPRAELSIQVEAAPGSPTSLTRSLNIQCDGNGNPTKSLNTQAVATPGDVIVVEPVIGARCTVSPQYDFETTLLVSFGPVLDGRIVDVWIVDQPELEIDTDGVQWGAVISDDQDSYPLWVGVYQNMPEGQSRPVKLDCPSGSSITDVTFGDYHRFSVQSGFEGGSCVLRADRSPYALAVGIAHVNLETGQANASYNGSLDLLPLTTDMTYFEVVDIYHHPLDDPYQFVLMLYRDVFGRAPDIDGVLYWGDQIDSGHASRASVVEAFTNSPEFGGSVAPISRLYSAYFERLPDVEGLQFWMGRLRTGHSLGSVSQFFAQSPEFQTRYGDKTDAEFVQLVYQNVLGRSPDQAGMSYWTSQLANGLSRGQLMIGFSESPENTQATNSRTIVVSVYVAMLGRTPEPGGLTYWSDRVDSGMDLTTLIESLLHSPEYEARFDVARDSNNLLKPHEDLFAG